MSIEITLLADLPVICVVFHEALTLEGVQYVFQKSTELTQGMPAPIYRISDIRKAQTSFAEMLKILQAARGGRAGSPTDPRIRQLFVGSNQWINMARNVMEQPQFGGVQIPIFASMDDAIAYVRADLNRLKHA